MDAISIGWIPGITGRHLPIPILPRSYAKSLQRSLRNGSSLQLLRLSASAIGTSNRFSKRISIFRVGEAPFCQLLPHMSRNCNVRTSCAKRRLCRTHTGPGTGRSLPVSPLASMKDEEYHGQAIQKTSADCELGTSRSESVPHYPHPDTSELKERGSISKVSPSVDRCYEREIFHRLEATEAAAQKNRHNWVPRISDPEHEPFRTTAGSSDMVCNSLALEDENCLLPLIGAPFRATGKGRSERTIDQRLKETRTSVLKHPLPPIVDRLGFQFAPKPAFSDQQSRQRAARMKVMVFYQMSYILERTLDVFRDSDIDHVLEPSRTLESHSSVYSQRKPAVFARFMDYRMSSRETKSIEIGTLTRERVGRSASYFGAQRHGRVRDPTSNLYPGSGGIFRSGSSVTMPAQNRTARRRLWSRAHSGMESAGNLFKDLLTIVGLVAFVVYGTYAFAMSQKYLKSGLWFGKTPGSSVVAARRSSQEQAKKETRPAPANLNQVKVVEITDENFVDTIQRRPTFVLFYASWCPYCQKLDPTWKELGNILNNKGYNIQLARMNAEMYTSTAANFKVVKYPTLIFFRGGIAVENYLGPRTVNSLVEFVDETLNKPC